MVPVPLQFLAILKQRASETPLLMSRGFRGGGVIGGQAKFKERKDRVVEVVPAAASIERSVPRPRHLAAPQLAAGPSATSAS